MNAHVLFALLAWLNTAADQPFPQVGDEVRLAGIVLPPQTHRVGAFGTGCDFATLQAAIDASGDRDTILVSTDAVHPVQATITHSLDIVGGYASCTASQPGTTPTQVTGTGMGRPLTLFHTGATRLRIRLAGLAIGSGESSVGGGVYADGGIDLVLADLSLEGHEATDRGGGLALFDGVGLRVEGRVDVRDNIAPLGAGVHCEDAVIEVDGRLVVADNEGTSVGGMSLQDCSLDGAPGSLLSLDGNSASLVSALAALGDSVVTLQGTTRVRFNAAISGQAVMVESPASLAATGPQTLFQANTTTFAPASVLRVTGGAQVQLGSGAGDCSLALANSSVTRACVAIAGNSSGVGAGAISLSGGSRLDLHRAVALANRSQSGNAHFANLSSGAVLGIASSVLFEHEGEGPLIAASDASIEISASTLANNPTAGSLFRLESGANITLHAIVAHGNAGDLLSLANGSSAAGTCLFVEDGFDAGGLALTGLVGNADFRHPDFSLRDFRPSDTSVFVDRCSDALPLPAHDLNGQSRPFDFPLLANLPGSYDAGAFELTDGAVFADGFEPPADDLP